MGRQHMYIKPLMPAGLPVNVKIMPQYFKEVITHSRNMSIQSFINKMQKKNLSGVIFGKIRYVSL